MGWATIAIPIALLIGFWLGGLNERAKQEMIRAAIEAENEAYRQVNGGGA